MSRRVPAARAGVIAAILLAAGPAGADDLPRPTREGIEALTGLIDRLVAAGGLRAVARPGAGDPYYAVADAAKLAAAVRAERARVGRPLVDALVGGWPAGLRRAGGAVRHRPAARHRRRGGGRPRR